MLVPAAGRQMGYTVSENRTSVSRIATAKSNSMNWKSVKRGWFTQVLILNLRTEYFSDYNRTRPSQFDQIDHQSSC